jgi:hypothetical protein
VKPTATSAESQQRAGNTLACARSEITERMIDEGVREPNADRRFENDWEVVARIYGAMRAAEI